MSEWTIVCHRATYLGCEETVEADSAESACQKALAYANDGGAWAEVFDAGESFVSAIIKDNGEEAPVPARFTEHHAPARVTVIIKCGAVQDVLITDGTAHVEVHDYDARADEPGSLKNDHGQTYTREDWSNAS